MMFLSGCSSPSNKDKPIVFCGSQDKDGDGAIDFANALFSMDPDADNPSAQYVAQPGPSFIYPPTLSPDGKNIAYYRDKALYKSDLSGNEIELIQIEEPISGIYWSNDGNRLAIQEPASPFDLFDSEWRLADSAGAATYTYSLIDFSPIGQDYYDTYSPNGKLFARYFSETGVTKVSKIDKEGFPKATVGEIHGNYEFIEWSPNSKQILLWLRENSGRPLDTDSDTSSESDPEADVDWGELLEILMKSSKATIFIADADGTNLTQVTAAGESSAVFRPAWSPDGKSIVYASWLEDTDGDNIADFEHPFSNLLTINKDGSGRKMLLDDTWSVTCLDW